MDGGTIMSSAYNSETIQPLQYEKLTTHATFFNSGKSQSLELTSHISPEYCLLTTFKEH